MMLEYFRLFLTLLCFCYTAYLDFRFREVDNWVWAVFGGVGLVLSFLSLEPFPFVYLILVSCLWLALWFLGAFGGADAKGLITLTLLLPMGFNNLMPLFPLVCFAVGCSFVTTQLVYSAIRRESLKRLEVPLLTYLLVGIAVSLSASILL
jgi:Flp pilus assembly protein protease CpaA